MAVSQTSSNRSLGKAKSAVNQKLFQEKQFRVSVIICTKDRPEECSSAVRSVCEQSVRPSEIIIVDGSLTEELEESVLSITDSYCIAYQYVKTKPQLTYQRNRGVNRMAGDIGLFIDDDVILDVNYIKNILDIYANEPNAGGVSGTVNKIEPASYVTVFRNFFCLWHPYGNGRMRPSGYGTYLFQPRRPQEVEIFEGCNMSYARDVLRKFCFDERIDVTGGNEDIDFSYRVSREYKLIQTPFATLHHNHSQSGRYDLTAQWERVIYWHYYFFRKNIDKTWINMVAYIWSNVGNFIGAIKRSIIARTAVPITGAIRGYARVFTDIKINKPPRF